MLTANPVLVLNASYEPISITSVRKAVVLVMKKRAETAEDSGRVLHASRVRIPVPSVIRLLDYRRIPRRENILSKRNILLRDRFTCQYCKKKLTGANLTLDHVIPRSRNGPDEWHNLVTCCKPCNNKKGNRTPAEAGFLIPKVSRYSIHTSRYLVRQAGEDIEGWRKYLFY